MENDKPVDINFVCRPLNGNIKPLKIIEVIKTCPDCGSKINEEGESTESCEGCLCYSDNPPDCSTCGYKSCDDSC